MKTENIYFVGIGGIGMSALARYFMHKGYRVGGYDLTRSHLTDQLEAEGASVHYTDDIDSVDRVFLDPERTVVIYTPAVPADHGELTYFRDRGFEVLKRSQVLGLVCEDSYVMAVAGTHGKTTTSTLVAWLNRCLTDGGNAVLGGISKNFGSNLVLGKGRRMAVEADEFDRSFLRLSPDVAVITSVDPDHLDIYGTYEAVREAFSQFVDRIRSGGTLILKAGVDIRLGNPDITVWRYSLDAEGDFHARSVVCNPDGCYSFDLVCPDRVIAGCRLGIPGILNVENAVAAVAEEWVASRHEGVELDEERLKRGLAEFSGVKRRMEVYVNTPRQVYIDDYAHHPRELNATITSVKAMFPGRKLTALFQPHLYTRTRDLCDGFAEALSHADEVVLLPIYPAREKPIEGVDSQMIARKLTVPYRIVERDRLVETVASMDTDIVVSFGAGNIDRCAEALAEVAAKKAAADPRSAVPEADIAAVKLK